MFKKPIVIVVGAGASFDVYGLPLGGELARRIASGVDFSFDHIRSRPIRGDADLYEQVLFRAFQRDTEQLNRYIDAGHRLSAAIGATVSVDDALYQLSEYPEAVRLGKICIARFILKAEQSCELRFDPNIGKPAPNAGREGWIEQIFSMAITGLKLSEIPDAFEKIIFVNFNYDRCIEHYLYWALQRIGIKSEAAMDIVDRLKMIRPYGTLGSIVGGETYLQFGEARPLEYFKLSERIRTFTESGVLHDRQQLSNALAAARMIVFLGFGFHAQNLELLSLSKEQQMRPGKVLATVFDVHQAVMPELKVAIGWALRIDTDGIETHEMKASEILKKLRMKINLALG